MHSALELAGAAPLAALQSLTRSRGYLAGIAWMHTRPQPAFAFRGPSAQAACHNSNRPHARPLRSAGAKACAPF